MPFKCPTRKRDGDRKGKAYSIETMILSFVCPANMENYSFNVLQELFNSSENYEKYFPILRGDSYKFETIPFGFSELTARFVVIILEVEKRILYELLTRKMLTVSECLARSQTDKVTMTDQEIVTKLSNYWRDKCVEKVAEDVNVSSYWKQLEATNHIEAVDGLIEQGMNFNCPQIYDDNSRLFNGRGKQDLIYKVPSRKEIKSRGCDECNAPISQLCFLCGLTSRDFEDDEQCNSRQNFSVHTYALNNAAFVDYYLFSIEIINKGTQLNRLKNSLKGVVMTQEGVVGSTIDKKTIFRSLYLQNKYVILDSEMQMQMKSDKPNWTTEAMSRHKKTSTSFREKAEQKKIPEKRSATTTTPTTTKSKKQKVSLEQLANKLLESATPVNSS